MGFFKTLINTFSGGVNCPACGTPGAKTSEKGVVCLNPFCRYFASTTQVEQSGSGTPVETGGKINRQADTQAPPAVPPGGSSVSIRYKNFQGQQKTFTADRSSLNRRHNHILARVAPSWKEIALSRDRIENLGEIDLFLPEHHRSNAPQPTARERQVLGYHKKHGTTSPLYEKIRAKYPSW